MKKSFFKKKKPLVARSNSDENVSAAYNNLSKNNKIPRVTLGNCTLSREDL
jgi:homoaconitase/3-isopropylmalate dehydratase large subunit